MSALMLRDMEELRGLSIGSPVPRPDDTDEFAITDGTILVNDDSPSTGESAADGGAKEIGNRSSSSESRFPAIVVDRCPAVNNNRQLPGCGTDGGGK